ncbi:MAG TPA: MerR family transcriptional regulator [Candidatus Polarisedimenticolaceae bacterium]|nr:MerR family transcriptional regulator [Candidatus Polarisedimenticolaceae bacterium]
MERTQIDVPDKLFYKASEVCQLTDTQPYVLRFWESEFPQLAAEKNRSGQRVYRRQDIDLIFRIKKLLYEEEYTIAGARKVLEDGVETALPGEPRPRKRAKEPEVEVEARAETAPPPPAPLFREPEPREREQVAPDAFLPGGATGDDVKHYRELYENALRAIDELKNDLAKTVTSRDILKERARRLAARLESSLQP